MNQKEIYGAIEFVDHEVRFVLGEFHNNQLNVLELVSDKTHYYNLPSEEVVKIKKESNVIYVETPTQILRYSIQILK